MEYVTLRRAGGSLVLTIPRPHARALGLSEGERIGVRIDEGKLVVDPSASDRPRYRLEDLVAQCDQEAPLSKEDEEWFGGRRAGNEML